MASGGPVTSGRSGDRTRLAKGQPHGLRSRVSVCWGVGDGGGVAYRCWALKYLQPSQKLLAASPPAAHIFTATQTKRDQAGGNWLPGHLIDPAMPPFAGQPLLHPPAAGWSSVPPTARSRRLRAPAAPRRSSSLGQEEDAAGSRRAGVHGCPHLPPLLPTLAATGPSLFPCPPTPCAFGVCIYATCRRPQTGALLTLPLTALSSPGLFLVPRHLALAGPAGDAPLPTLLCRGMRSLGWVKHRSSGDPGPLSSVCGPRGNFVQVRKALGSGPSGSGPLPPSNPSPNPLKSELVLATAGAGSGLPVAGVGIVGLPLSARRKLWLRVRTSTGLLGTLVGFSAVMQNCPAFKGRRGEIRECRKKPIALPNSYFELIENAGPTPLPQLHVSF